MNIAAINFTAIPGNSCRGCICNHERVAVCETVNQRAKACGLPLCDVRPDHICVLAGAELFGMVEQVTSEVAPSVEQGAASKHTTGD